MLVRQLGLEPVHVCSPDIDETPHAREKPRVYAARMSHEKALAGQTLQPGQIILAADTTVAVGQRILPPADDEATARECLALLSGRRHNVYSAVTVLDEQGEARHRLAKTSVKFKRLSAAEVDAYIASGEWEGKAGGYAIQGLASVFVNHINGSYSAVVGLPLFETRALFEAVGIHVLAPSH
jgi:septum formation protein